MTDAAMTEAEGSLQRLKGLEVSEPHTHYFKHVQPFVKVLTLTTEKVPSEPLEVAPIGPMAMWGGLGYRQRQRPKGGTCCHADALCL